DFVKGDEIIKEGEDGDYFYIIEEGSVDCIKSQEDLKQDPILVRTLSKGDHFGELALINNVKRSLSVKVASDTCKLLALGREAFTRILGNIKKYLNTDYGGTFDKQFKK